MPTVAAWGAPAASGAHIVGSPGSNISPPMLFAPGKAARSSCPSCTPTARPRARGATITPRRGHSCQRVHVGGLPALHHRLPQDLQVGVGCIVACWCLLPSRPAILALCEDGPCHCLGAHGCAVVAAAGRKVHRLGSAVLGEGKGPLSSWLVLNSWGWKSAECAQGAGDLLGEMDSLSGAGGGGGGGHHGARRGCQALSSHAWLPAQAQPGGSDPMPHVGAGLGGGARSWAPLLVAPCHGWLEWE